MNDEVHSESGFYYPVFDNEGDETAFCQFNDIHGTVY
jgi:hypothetical protein